MSRRIREERYCQRWLKNYVASVLLLNLQVMKPTCVFSAFSQFSSVTQSCPTLCDPMNRSMLGLSVHHQLLTSIESVIPSSHLILCCPLLLLPPIPPSIRVFSSESTLCMRWPKYWSFSFSVFLPKKSQDWSPSE